MPPIFRAVALRAAGAVLFALAVTGSAHAADLRADEVRAVLANAPRDKSVDFSGKDLSDLDLSNVDFKRANLSGANLSDSDLQQADLFATNLTGATFHNTTCPDGTRTDTGC